MQRSLSELHAAKESLSFDLNSAQETIRQIECRYEDKQNECLSLISKTSHLSSQLKQQTLSQSSLLNGSGKHVFLEKDL